ncbi:unnamed protein product [Nesidiocoris tenuis]|uniref:Uncharacterized protein n=1 Tax=Nesidiocoris tenuis TaxID=355587 RepID=A0A6H5H6M9_9HEMI|nr:unnamed protein product [Nesidiocoris tenuis]
MWGMVKLILRQDSNLAPSATRGTSRCKASVLPESEIFATYYYNQWTWRAHGQMWASRQDVEGIKICCELQDRTWRGSRSDVSLKTGRGGHIAKCGFRDRTWRGSRSDVSLKTGCGGNQVSTIFFSKEMRWKWRNSSPNAVRISSSPWPRVVRATPRPNWYRASFGRGRSSIFL